MSTEADVAAAPVPVTSSKPSPLAELGQNLGSVKYLNRRFWVLAFIYTLDGAAYFGILNLLTLYLGGDVKMSDRWSGFGVSYMSGALTLCMALFGGIVDRIGVRKTMLIAISVGLAGRSLLLAAPGFLWAAPLAFAALTMMAFSAGIVMSSAYAGVKQATDARTSAIGFSLLYAFMNGGSVVESFVSPLVREAFGMRGVFIMCTALTAVYLLVHFVLYPREAEPAAKTDAPTIVEPAAAKTAWRDHPLAQPRFMFFIFVLLGVRTLFAHQWLTMPAYIMRAYPAEVGARMEWINGLINPAIIFFCTPLVAALTGRVHVVRMMIIGTLVSACATFLLVPGPNLSALIGYIVIFSLGEAMWSSRFLEYVGQIAPANRVGLYMGVANIPWFLAKFTTGFYSGFMLEKFCPPAGAQDTSTLWLIYAFVGLSSPLGLILAQKWLMRR